MLIRECMRSWKRKNILQIRSERCPLGVRSNIGPVVLGSCDRICGRQCGHSKGCDCCRGGSNEQSPYGTGGRRLSETCSKGTAKPVPLAGVHMTVTSRTKLRTVWALLAYSPHPGAPDHRHRYRPGVLVGRRGTLLASVSTLCRKVKNVIVSSRESWIVVEEIEELPPF
jgi:hypothetical protein